MSLLLGKPESGKTTLTRILSAHVPRFSGGECTGTVRLNGRDILRELPYDLLETVGLAFQDPDEQFITTRCDTEVAFGLESLGMERTAMEKRVRDAFESLDILHLMRRKTGDLSGGEKKKVILASLIALSPSLLVLDEALEEIDEVSRIAILELLKNNGRSVLITSSRLHDFYQNYVDIYLLLSSKAVLREDHCGEIDFRSLCRKEGLLFDSVQEGVADRKFRAGDGALEEMNGSSGDVLLSASGVKFSYPGSGFSLSVEEFTVRESETIALIGRNGSGKSTLARILSGLIEPEEGRVSIRIKGRWKDASPRDLNTFTGYVFQNPDYQIFLPTVEEELSYGLKKLGVKEAEIKSRVAEAAGLFRLPELSVPPAMMSYGARKRLQAAVYYLLERPLYILDEADSGLSFDDFLSILSIFRRKECGLVIITHDLGLARQVSHRTYTLECGRIV